MSITELAAEALRLKPEEQQYLLSKLAQALDPEVPELTNEELEQRWAGFVSGDETGIPSEELHAQARQRYGLA
jgi:hypothetical protein